MIFRYCGLGVGHKNTWEATEVLREDICKAFGVSLVSSSSALSLNEESSSESEIDGNEEPAAAESDDSEISVVMEDDTVESDEELDDGWETEASDAFPDDNSEDLELLEEDLDCAEEELDGQHDEDDNEGGKDEEDYLGYSRL